MFKKRTPCLKQFQFRFMMIETSEKAVLSLCNNSEDPSHPRNIMELVSELLPGIKKAVIDFLKIGLPKE